MRFQTLYEGRWIFALLIVVAIIAWFTKPWLMVLPIVLILFCINFFRDPTRAIPASPGEIVSAADGTVVEIEEMEESEVTKKRMRRVAVFLSVFNVHVNRTPCEGKVVFSKHYPGTYLDARNPECSKKNEAMTWAFEWPKATLVVRQITGAIARRIVPWATVGETLRKGDRFGMIRFGSRTEVYLPLDYKIEVKIGDKVQGGSTVIARIP